MVQYFVLRPFERTIILPSFLLFRSDTSVWIRQCLWFWALSVSCPTGGLHTGNSWPSSTDVSPIASLTGPRPIFKLRVLLIDFAQNDDLQTKLDSSCQQEDSCFMTTRRLSVLLTTRDSASGISWRFRSYFKLLGIKTAYELHALMYYACSILNDDEQGGKDRHARCGEHRERHAWMAWLVKLTETSYY